VKRENNITICLKQIGQKDVDGNVVEDRKSGELGEKGRLIKFRAPKRGGKFLDLCSDC
jgi:hypothetical protein